MRPSQPTQLDCNSLAAFIEAAEELRAEPFFSPDDKATLRWQDGKSSAHFGDRFHFRSALVSFRRIWLNDEASNFFRVCKLLDHFETTSPTTWILRDEHRRYASMRWGKMDLKAEQIVDLWLNTVFAHSNLTRPKPQEKHWHDRVDFDRLAKAHGQEHLEFICRTTVKSIGRCCYIQALRDIHNALKRWEKAYGLKPDFEIGLPFGAAFAEEQDNGTTIFRQPSTEFLAVETAGQRFKRILARRNFAAVEALVRALAGEVCLGREQVNRADGICELLKEFGFAIQEVPDLTWQLWADEMFEKGRFKALLPIATYNPNEKLGTALTVDGTAFTNAESVVFLDKQLSEFRREFEAPCRLSLTFRLSAE